MQKEYIQLLSKQKILLDSNSYFRLADNLYPLLSEPFGSSIIYVLKILGGTLREYNYQTRLQSKFSWVDNPRHIEDRKGNKLRIKKIDQERINKTKEFILQDSISSGFGCSRFDIECLATALELSIILVTDDGDLYDLACEYGVVCRSSIELLKLMYDEKQLTLKNVQDTVYMWDYMKDIPRNFYEDFKINFNLEPEKYS